MTYERANALTPKASPRGSFSTRAIRTFLKSKKLTDFVNDVLIQFIGHLLVREDNLCLSDSFNSAENPEEGWLDEVPALDVEGNPLW